MKKTFKTILKIRTDRKIFCVLGKEDYTNLQQSFKFSLIYAFNMISIKTSLGFAWASKVAQLVKNLPAMQETRIQFLDREDSHGEGNWLPTPVFWPGEFHGLFRPWGSQRVAHDWVTFTFTKNTEKVSENIVMKTQKK